MINSPKSKLVIEGGKNAVVQVSGILYSDITEPEIIVDLGVLSHHPKALRIEAVEFAIEEKMGFHLWWMMGGDRELIMPLESRGNLSFSDMQGVHSPTSGLTGIGLTSFRWERPSKAFLIMLDLTKQ